MRYLDALQYQPSASMAAPYSCWMGIRLSLTLCTRAGRISRARWSIIQSNRNSWLAIPLHRWTAGKIAAAVIQPFQASHGRGRSERVSSPFVEDLKGIDLQFGANFVDRQFNAASGPPTWAKVSRSCCLGADNSTTVGNRNEHS